MILSMTGFGKAMAELPDKKISVEIKSLNSKQLDLNTRVPAIYREKEMEIRSLLLQAIERGKVDFSIFAEESDASWLFREIGIFAEDPDLGEILYAYANTGDNYDTIPPHGASTYLKRIVKLPVEVANAANIHMNISEIYEAAVDNIDTEGARVFSHFDDETNKYMLRRLAAGEGITITEENGQIVIGLKQD